MPGVIVFVPRGTGFAGGPGVRVVGYADGSGLEAAIAESPAGGIAVVVSDGIAPEHEQGVADAIRRSGATAIEVRLGTWDGERHSAVSAACGGVISGFGAAGIAAAVTHALELRGSE